MHGCLESVEWNGGMERWNGTLEWNTGIVKPYPAYKDEINICNIVSSLMLPVELHTKDYNNK